VVGCGEVVVDEVLNTSGVNEDTSNDNIKCSNDSLNNE